MTEQPGDPHYNSNLDSLAKYVYLQRLRYACTHEEWKCSGLPLFASKLRYQLIGLQSEYAKF